MVDKIKNVDKNLAFIMELIGGFFGILGIGYMYSGLITEGLIRLVAWLAIIIFAWTCIIVLSFCYVGICFIPIMVVAQIAVPIWSALEIKKKLEAVYPE
jgi:hypothetical protein